MKKKLVVFFILLLLCMPIAIPVFAANSAPRLVDNADYLTDAEEAELQNKLDEVSTRQGLDIVIVTIPALYGEDITAFADDFYDYTGYGADGILLLISDYDREWAISTAGYGITVFTDAGLDYLSGRFGDALSEGQYCQAFHTFADLSDVFITQAKTGKPYDVGNLPNAPFNAVKSLLISVGIGLFAALLVTGSMKSKLKTVHAQAEASQYVKPGSMNITEGREMFLYRQLHRQKRESRTSGGSSTHTSGSGKTHGGSKGSF